jgi:hypothetical protein
MILLQSRDTSSGLVRLKPGVRVRFRFRCQDIFAESLAGADLPLRQLAPATYERI